MSIVNKHNCQPLTNDLSAARRIAAPQVCVELVITKDDGNIEVFNGYRVQHNNSRGPFKGGLRYHPQVDLDDVRRRAAAGKY